jgi:predicted nucleic acid-binding protein
MVFDDIGDGRLQVMTLTSEESMLRDALLDTLGAGERESIAVAKNEKGR